MRANMPYQSINRTLREMIEAGTPREAFLKEANRAKYSTAMQRSAIYWYDRKAK